MGITCKKCGFINSSVEATSSGACPQCGAIYAKVDKYLAEKAAREEKNPPAKPAKESEPAPMPPPSQVETKASPSPEMPTPKTAPPQQVIVKTYKGNEQEAMKAFQADAAVLANQGYLPTVQTWAAGSWGCGSFVLAGLLCFVGIGVLVFIYMMIVKPAGILSVTYEYKERAVATAAPMSSTEKTCPNCAEDVKAAAKVCRYCGYSFESKEHD